MSTAAEVVLARVVREHAGRLAASLVGLIGDFPTAEDLVADAVEAALQHWPREGIPSNPDGWLYTVARRRGLDVLRRNARYRDKLAQAPWPPQPVPDDRLRLIFTCCHPALPRTAQMALTLRVVCGLTTAQIAKAFLIPETTVAQRITRAKRKISDAAIPYRIPDADELGARLGEVLTVVYLLFNEAYLSSSGEHAASAHLAADAEFLAGMLASLMPAEPEVLGLLALIRLHQARTAARFTPDGELIQLPDQDRSLWDHKAIADATGLIAKAASFKRPGPYQLQAAIVAVHSEAPRWQDTDWQQILLLYTMLDGLAPSPVTKLHRAIALRYVTGPQAALSEVDALDGLGQYHLWHATRAELLRDLGRTAEARAADQRALELTANPAEQSLLRQRISWA